MSTITVTPTVELGATPPRVRLDVSDANLPGYFAANVVRNNPDGSTANVRTVDGGPLPLVTSGSNRIGTVYDYEVPYGSPVTYTTVESPTVVSAPVTVNETRVWLIHPGVPALSQSITVAEFGERTRTVMQGVYYPLGRRTPVVHTDGQRRAPGYTLTVYVATELERAALETLTEDTSPLLLNVPADKGFGVGAEYVAVGDMSEARLGRFAGNPGRMVSLSCNVVDRPAGGTAAERTYLDLLEYATYRDLAMAYPTYLALLSGP